MKWKLSCAEQTLGKLSRCALQEGKSPHKIYTVTREYSAAMHANRTR